MFNYITILT